MVSNWLAMWFEVLVGLCVASHVASHVTWSRMVGLYVASHVGSQVAWSVERLVCMWLAM